jgi:manganese transport system ATP-binding protein
MSEPAVSARDLTLGYNSKVVFAKSSFTIPEAQLTAVIGPNGSGKSTLLNAIAGLLEPLSGSLTVAARANGGQRIAYVLQTNRVNEVLPITVREVVTMGRYAGARRYRRLIQADHQAVAAAMDRTGIADLENRHLHDLSVGQSQRVFVAQGLAQDHDVLLLDEPLTGLDLPTASAIDAVIHNERAHGCTVVITTHDLSEARVADHVLLVAGHVVAAGPPDDVLTTDHLVDAYGSSLVHGTSGRLFVDDAAHHRSEIPH